MATAHKLLQIALAVVGVIFMLLYPLSLVWPSGWQWHIGLPYESDYFMMIVGLYVTLGVFLLIAARKPADHLSLVWFTVWSSAVHAVIMAVQSVIDPHRLGHLFGDVPGLILVAVVLAVLVRAAKLTRGSAVTARET